MPVWGWLNGVEADAQSFVLSRLSPPVPGAGVVVGGFVHADDLMGAFLIGFGWEFVFRRRAGDGRDLGALINRFGVMPTFIGTAVVASATGLRLLLAQPQPAPL